MISFVLKVSLVCQLLRSAMPLDSFKNLFLFMRDPDKSLPHS